MLNSWNLDSTTGVGINRPDVDPSGCTVTIVRDAAGLKALEGKWKALFASSPTASPPLRFEWVQEWWRVFGPVYGDGGRGLRVLTVRRGSGLIGVLPLYEHRAGSAWLGLRRLRFVSTGAAEFEETCAEYLDLLHAPGEAEACVEALGRVLRESSELTWDELDLADMAEGSPLVGLASALGGGGRIVKVSAMGVCYVSDLEGGFETYLGRLASGTRKKARQMLRHLQRDGMRFEVARTEGEVNGYFDQLVELHRKRWQAEGKAGSFAPRHAEFHRSVALRLVPQGGVILARLSHEDQPLALVYGHRVGTKFDCYQVGSTRETTLYRTPGAAAHLGLMFHLCERGVLRYDYLSGFNRLKQDFAKDTRKLVSLRVTKPTLAAAAFWGGDLTRRALRRGARILSRPAPRALEPQGEGPAEAAEISNGSPTARNGDREGSARLREGASRGSTVSSLSDSEVL